TGKFLDQTSASFHKFDSAITNEEYTAPTINNATDGIKEGLKSAGMGFVSGFSGLVTKPIQGAINGGPMGAVKGFSQGVSGVIIKPIVGVVDLVDHSARGINQSVKNHSTSSFGGGSNRSVQKPASNVSTNPYVQNVTTQAQSTADRKLEMEKVENKRFESERESTSTNFLPRYSSLSSHLVDHSPRGINRPVKNNSISSFGVGPNRSSFGGDSNRYVQNTSTNSSINSYVQNSATNSSTNSYIQSSATNSSTNSYVTSLTHLTTDRKMEIEEIEDERFENERDSTLTDVLP
ncbi:hypothetical protein HK096_001539, partial [Nowakowskiella sp. JEL0078]